jgi:recombination protein RecR
LDTFAKRITALREHVAVCTFCFRYFARRRTENECQICASPRNEKLLMIVEKDVDLDNVERLGGYDGYYIVLGGTIPLSGADEGGTRATQLTAIVEKRAQQGLREVILAMGANPDGEHTSDVVREMLQPITAKYSLATTTLGRGLSTGLELEYSDAATIKSALQNRV